MQKQRPPPAWRSAPAAGSGFRERFSKRAEYDKIALDKTKRRPAFWQPKQNSGSWQSRAVRSTIFIPASGIWCGGRWRLRPSCWQQGRTKRPPCWTERPRALSSSSWRRVPSRFLAPGAWSSCRRSTQALTATKTWTSSARRWAVWKTPWWCWAPCLTWNAISSNWASGRKSSSTSAKSWALPRNWPNPSPMS